MDMLVKKAWELYRHTARFPVKTIHTATIWLEEKHCKKPSEKVAVAIALHYLILRSVRSRNGIGDRAGILRASGALADQGP
jgi:hypothetical protein